MRAVLIITVQFGRTGNVINTIQRDGDRAKFIKRDIVHAWISAATEKALNEKITRIKSLPSVLAVNLYRTEITL